LTQIWDDRLADGHTDGQTHTQKKGSAGQNLSGRARAIFTRAVNLRGFPPGVPTGVGKNYPIKQHGQLMSGNYRHLPFPEPHAHR